MAFNWTSTLMRTYKTPHAEIIETKTTPMINNASSGPAMLTVNVKVNSSNFPNATDAKNAYQDIFDALTAMVNNPL